MKRLLASALLAFLLVSPVSSAEISVFEWNGNGGRRPVADVADTVHDLYGVIDVRVSAIEPFTDAAKREDVWLDSRFEFLGETGGLVLWNRMKLKRIDSPEAESRAHMAARFEVRGSGEQFWFVLVDFDDRPNVNQRQVESLKAWIDDQSSPVLVVGNLGFDVDSNRFLQYPNWEPDHDAYSELTAHGLAWVRPPRLYALPAEVEFLDYIAFTNGPFEAWNPVASVCSSKSAHPPTSIILQRHRAE